MADTTSSLDPTLLQSNVDSLRIHFPDLAARIDEARNCSPRVLAASTRDGGVNFRIQEPDGESWFGRTSIPFVRAQALVDRFQAGQANVLLPGIGEGSEVELLLQRLGPHRAVFVWEQNVVNLRLALQLHDFAEAIASGRLMLVLAEPARLTEAMLETLAQLPGLLCPERILMWPWLTPAEVAPWRSAVEAAYHEIEQRRQTWLNEVRHRLESLPPEPDGRRLTALLCSAQTQEETWAWADALVSESFQAGWHLVPALIRSPGDVHPLARVSRLAEGLERAPDLALLLDSCRAELSEVLPASVPAISWLSRRTSIDQTLPGRLGPKDFLIATDSTVAEQLAAAGVDPNCVTVCPQPVLAPCNGTADWQDRPFDVALVANLAPLDSQAYGFDLSSHVAVWKAALDLLRAELDDFSQARVRSLLTRAESKARTKIDDPELRSRIMQVLGGPVACTLILNDLAQHLANCKLAITCLGQGWAPQPGLDVAGAQARLADRIQVWQRAKCALFVSTTGGVAPDVLLAACAGAAVLWRAHPKDDAQGGFSTLLTPGSQAVVFERNRNATEKIVRLLDETEKWREIVTSAIERCRTDHAPNAALARIRVIAGKIIPPQPA